MRGLRILRLKKVTRGEANLRHGCKGSGLQNRRPREGSSTAPGPGGGEYSQGREEKSSDKGQLFKRRKILKKDSRDDRPPSKKMKKNRGVRAGPRLRVQKRGSQKVRRQRYPKSDRGEGIKRKDEAMRLHDGGRDSFAEQRRRTYVQGRGKTK